MFSHNSAKNVKILYKQLQWVETQGNLSRDSGFLLKREEKKERLIHFYYPPPSIDDFHSDVIKL